MSNRLVGFIDGENLVLRYQHIVGKGRTPAPGVIHEKDLYIWHPKITNQYFMDIVRLSYYQTVVGDHPKVEQACEDIGNVHYSFNPRAGEAGDGFLRPRVFKKEAKSSKTKSVDINLTVDMLRHAGDPQFDILLLASGDGDYLPLVEEVARKGKQVWLAAFTDGLSRRLRHAADEFMSLDELFFD